MKLGIIIQARNDSKRFPKKVLRLIDNKPVLWHVINQSKKIYKNVIVATTTRKLDQPIIDIAKESNVEFFCGSKNDVLDRYYQASKKFRLDGIIRITADCPFIDPKESIKVLKFLQTNKFDYIALDEKTYPDGLDTEGFTFNILKEAWKNAKMTSEREHVTPYIKKQKTLKKKIIKYHKDLSKYRFTVDYEDDLEFLKKVLENVRDKNEINLKNILQILKEHPKIRKINQNHERNEGYKKSILEDKKL